MKYPLDKVCVKSGIFCPSCQRKLDTGVVEYSEVDVIKALIELEDRLVELRRGEYVKSYTLDNTVVLIVRNGWEKRELDVIAKKVSEKLGKRVRIAIDTGDKRRLIEQIVAPAHVLGVNAVWLPDGSEQVVIRMQRRDRKRFSNLPEWESLFSKILGKTTRIVFE